MLRDGSGVNPCGVKGETQTRKQYIYIQQGECVQRGEPIKSQPTLDRGKKEPRDKKGKLMPSISSSQRDPLKLSNMIRSKNKLSRKRKEIHGEAIP